MPCLPFGLLCRRRRFGFHCRHGLPHLLQPALPKGQLCWQLITTLVLTVPPVCRVIHFQRSPQQLRHLRRQLRRLLLHPPVTHRLMLRCVGLHLGPVQRHLPQLHQSSQLAPCQHLQEQVRQLCQVVLAKVRDGAEVRRVVRRQHPKRDVLARLHRPHLPTVPTLLYAHCAAELAAIVERIRGSPVAHADETGWREDGNNGYVCDL